MIDNDLQVLLGHLDRESLQGNKEVYELLEGLSHQLERRGIKNNTDMLEFYFATAMMCQRGRLSLDRDIKDGQVFGFAELADLLALLSESTGSGDLESGILNQLKFVGSRDLSLLSNPSEAIIEEMLAEDIGAVKVALGLSVQKSSLPVEVKESLKLEDEFEDEATVMALSQLKKSSKLRSLVKGELERILEVYDEALGVGYELDLFKGVMVGELRFGVIQVSHSEGISPMGSTASLTFAREIMEGLDVIVDSSSRQIDLEKIHSSAKPIYFPNKIAEFALSQRVTSRSQSFSYAKVPSVWETKKSDGYSHRKAISAYLEKQLWLYVKLVTDKSNLWEDEHFTSDFRMALLPETSSLYSGFLAKFTASMCTFAILRSVVGSEEDWASAEWIISCPPRSFKRSGFTSASNSYKQIFRGKGDILRPIVVPNESDILVQFYSHVSDAQVADSEPLFAYKALESLQAKGEKLSFKNQLIGRSLTGRLMTSSPTAEVYFGSSLFLALSSGSRSGKGVMTNAVITSAVMDELPVPIVDRKPDTSVIYYEMFGGSDEKGTPKGFLVQGGAFSQANMVGSDKTKQELNWNTNPKVFGRRARLVPDWWGINSYDGIWGDMAYYRSMLLWLGIIALRSQVLGSVEESKKALYEKLGGKDGVLFVVDEVTNWINNFSKTSLHTNGFFGDSQCFKAEDLADIKACIRKLKDKKLTDSKREELEETLSEYRQGEWTKKLYNRDLFEKLAETLTSLDTYNRAGFQDKESKYSTVMIIGQDLQIEGLGTTLPRTKKGGDPASFGTDPMREVFISTLYGLDTSYILGYNFGDGKSANQGWRATKGSDSSKYLTETGRRFAYFNRNYSLEELRDANSANRDRAKSVKSYKENGAVYFKPYLILNDGKEGSTPVEGLKTVLGDRYDAIKQNNSSDGGRTWDKRIGLEDYMLSMGAKDLSTSFVKAREIAELVIAQMGYEGDYLDFVLDLRPEWNFSVKDVVEAFTTEGANEKRLKNMWYTKAQDLLSSLDVKEDEVEETDFVPQFSNEGIDNVEEIVHADEVEGTPSFKDSYSESSDRVSPVDDGLTEGHFEQVNVQDKGHLRDYEGQNGGIPFGAVNNQEAVSSLASQLGVPEVTFMSMLRDMVSNYQNGKGSEVANNVSDLNNREQFEERGFANPEQAEDIVLNGWIEAKEFITKDILNTYSGLSMADDSLNNRDYRIKALSRLNRIEVMGGNIYINKQKYAPMGYPANVSFVNIPSDLLARMENRQFGYFFYWDELFLQELTGLRKLSIDDYDYFLYEICDALGVPLQSGNIINGVFAKIPSLMEIQIDDDVFSRSDMEREVLKREKWFKSKARREQMVENLGQTGQDFRQSQWQRSKENFNSGHGLMGAFNVLGAGLGVGMQGTSKAVKTTSSFLGQVKRFGNTLIKATKEEFSHKDDTPPHQDKRKPF